MAASFAQERLWFLQNLEPEGTAYNLVATMPLPGPFDENALISALREIVARHEILRTTFGGSDGDVHQIVHTTLPLEPRSTDLSHLTPAEADEEARRLAAEDVVVPFDLTTGPLLRPHLIVLPGSSTVLSVVAHHIVLDQWSVGVFKHELTTLYRDFQHDEPPSLAPLPIQYADYSVWQRETLTGGPLEEQLAYWRTALAGPAELTLPTDRPRPPVRTTAGSTVSFSIPKEVKERLDEASLRAGASLFMTLLAGLQILLFRYCRQDDVAVGVPVSGRHHPNVDRLIGFFVNTLVIRSHIDPDDTASEVIGRARKTLLHAYAHQDVPFDMVVEALQPKRERGRNPLFDVMLSFRSQDGPSASAGDSDMTSCDFGPATAKFDLTFDLAVAGEVINGSIEYSTELFDRPTIEQLGEHFRVLLEAMATDTGTRVLELPLVSDAERTRLLNVLPQSATVQCPQDAFVHEMLSYQARRSPRSVAVIADGLSLSYAELESRANRLARHLRSLGVSREDVVALYLPRSVALPVGVIGALKAGAAFRIFRPEPGAERSAPEPAETTALVHPDLSDRVPDGFANVVLVDDHGGSPSLDRLPATSPGRPGLHPANAACVVRPVGADDATVKILVSHDGLAISTAAVSNLRALDTAAEWPLSHPADSDRFVVDLLAALAAGQRLVLEAETAAFPAHGSAFDRTSASCHVLEPNLQPAPTGAIGELHIGGPSIGRECRGRAARTAGRFIPDPHAADGSRLFRTGTLARWCSDGRLELLRHESRDRRVAAEGSPGSAPMVRRLVAYVVPAPGRAAPSGDELRAFLRTQLPESMVPTAFVSLQELPLAPSGKVDHGALPAPEGPSPAFAEAATPTERALADIWRRVLGVTAVGTTNDFFELGGHSLLAARIVARVREEMHVDLPIGTVFEASTLGALAAEVDAASPAAPLPAIERTSRGGALALSFAQQRLWFLSRLQPDSTEYNVPLALELRGDLDDMALRKAVDEVVSRHEILRTTYAADAEGMPVQIVHPPAAVDLPLIDLAAMAPGPARAQARRLNDEDAITPFDLDDEPPLRLRLIRLSRTEHVLGITFHHIASDEWSTAIFTRELSALYEAFRVGRPSPLKPVPVQYGDYAAWQRTWLTGDTRSRLLNYWATKLADLPAMDLPSDRPRPRERDPSGALYTFTFPGDLTRRIQELSLRAGCSTFMTLLAAFQALLARYTATEDIAVGTPVAGRTHPDTENLIGFFVNTVVLRTDLSGDPTFADLLRRVRATSLEAFDHQDVPYEQLVDALQPVRDRGRNPLFDIMFGFDAAENGDEKAATDPAASPSDLDLCTFPGEQTMSKFDMSLDFFPSGDGLRGRARYRTAVLDPAGIERMTVHLRSLLEAVVADPDTRISAVDFMGAPEHAQLAKWRRGPQMSTRGGLVHELIEEKAKATPDSIAVKAAGTSLSYRSLDERANRLAHRLQSLGVGPEKVVGVCLGRDHDLVTALLAIWKAGGVYLPLDPEDPAERIAFQVADTGAHVIITNDGLRDQVTTGQDRLLLIDAPAELAAIDRRSPAPPACRIRPANTAYLTYTSGSTGTPKAVATLHGGLANRLLWQIDAHAYTPADRVLHKDRIAFDVSLWELCCPLLAGAKVVMAPPEVPRDPEALCRLIDHEQITVTRFVASMLDAFLDVVRPGQCASLRFILCGGEAVPGRLARRWYRRFGLGTTLRIGYGPTEASIGVSEYRLEHEPGEDRTAPIGVPIANTTLHVLDRRLRPAPAGSPGEILIGGPQLARGYQNRPSLTAERFVPDPVAGDGSRLYRTGDLARWRADGQLEFLGRTDDQVKLRGHRIEPAEIESALTAHQQVARAVVIARGDDRGRARLLAYLVPAQLTCPSAKDLRDFLGARLPDHMIPESFTFLDALPATVSGKVDRNALPAPASAQQAAPHEPPRTETERAIADIWAEVLEAEHVGAHDNFFEMGGHSLLAVRIATRVRSRFGIDIPVARLFDAPVLAGYSAAVEQTLIEEIRQMSDEEALRLLSGDEDVP